MANDLRIFIGFERRQPIALNVLQFSLYRRASKPVQITPLVLDQLPMKRRGLTEFTYSRFLVPYLCGYRGSALFLDADMLVMGDIAELFDLSDPQYAVQVVKNKQHFEWPSMMLFNNARCTHLTPEFVEFSKDLFKMTWGNIGELPPEWNHCVGYDKATEVPKLIHYTKGVPVWEETAGCDYASLWHEERKAMMATCSFEELMGKSIHVA